MYPQRNLVMLLTDSTLFLNHSYALGKFIMEKKIKTHDTDSTVIQYGTRRVGTMFCFSLKAIAYFFFSEFSFFMLWKKD